MSFTSSPDLVGWSFTVAIWALKPEPVRVKFVADVTALLTAPGVRLPALGAAPATPTKAPLTRPAAESRLVTAVRAARRRVARTRDMRLLLAGSSGAAEAG